MYSLVQECHLLDLKGVVAEFNSRMKMLSADFLQDVDRNDTTVESPKSISARLMAYDYYKKFGKQFS